MKNKIIALVLLISTLLSCSFFSSCEKELSRFTEYSFEYFDTVSTITGYAGSKEEFDKVADRIFSELSEYHKLYTIYHRFDGLENLCTVNELKDRAHRTVKVDPRIIDMLEYSVEMNKKTGGVVNVAMGSVLSIWHEYRTEGCDDPVNAALPPMDKLTEAAAHTDINKLLIDRENSTVTLTDPDMKLDVGAIAKGYSVEMIARGLEKDGISGYVLNIGGNIRTVGRKGNGEKWTVGIEDPAGGEDYIAYLELAGESLVTSGSYQRYYVVDGKRYHHIIDPETLYPSEGFLSVSVVCKSSADGDALSTALFCMNLDEGIKFVESLDEVEAMWVTNTSEIHYSSGFKDYIKAD